MSLNNNELAYIGRLLDQQITGGAVQKIHQPQEAMFVIESYGGACGKARLHIELRAGEPLLYLATNKLKNPDTPTALCALMRTQLANARIRGIETLNGDRICFINFEKMTTAGPKQRRLVLELIPGYPVLFLVDENDKILGASQSVRNKHRDLGRGATYMPPPANEAVDNSDLFTDLPDWTEENIFALLEESNKPRTETIDKSALQKEVARALKRMRKKINKIEVDIRRMEDQEIGGDQGELLKSAIGDIKPGMTEIRVRDWGQEGEVWEIVPLDPSVSPQENLERLFRKAKKSARGQESANQRIAEQRVELSELMKFEEMLQDKDQELEPLVTKAKRLGLKVESKQGQPTKKKIVQARRQPFKSYTSKDGIEIRVGRSSRDNDEVTFQHCKGNEWWFHADGYAGSHVVAKTSEELPQETLLDAAILAVEHSKAASGGKQAVSYTQRKNVSKYKGARPGQVILRTHKTILIRFEPERLSRLQKSGSGPKD
ncbi:MAG: putative ribosome quality control (RQC) complex YloA/Tae2 family protein [Planctomycetota bacterium]|jgi:predicted ribosome quality control (RQC) complex YloA/Tae2 family protein